MLIKLKAGKHASKQALAKWLPLPIAVIGVLSGVAGISSEGKQLSGIPPEKQQRSNGMFVAVHSQPKTKAVIERVTVKAAIESLESDYDATEASLGLKLTEAAFRDDLLNILDLTISPSISSKQMLKIKLRPMIDATCQSFRKVIAAEMLNAIQSIQNSSDEIDSNNLPLSEIKQKCRVEMVPDAQRYTQVGMPEEQSSPISVRAFTDAFDFSMAKCTLVFDQVIRDAIVILGLKTTNPVSQAAENALSQKCINYLDASMNLHLKLALLEILAEENYDQDTFETEQGTVNYPQDYQELVIKQLLHCWLLDSVADYTKYAESFLDEPTKRMLEKVYRETDQFESQICQHPIIDHAFDIFFRIAVDKVTEQNVARNDDAFYFS